MNCKYCGKECKNLNSLRQHEIRCKLNPDKISIKIVHTTKTGFTKGKYKWMTKDNINKLIDIDLINEYINNGWKFGLNDEFKSKVSNGLIGHSIGKSLDPIKEEQRKQKISNSMKGNMNWKNNKKHGNSKQGWYKGIHCDSTWELAFLVYHIENNLFIKRCDKQFKYIFNNEEHIYIPDFITNEGIIEIKGRFNKQALEKQKQYPEIIIYDKEKIKFYLDYVINKYGIDFYKKLYE